MNAGQRADQTRLPPEHELDFLSGSHLIVSRDFLNDVGLMNESYFLYYEEVDWCFRRGKYDLRLIEGAEILHIGGTSIGSGALKRSPSPFSYYVNTRSRMRFVRRFLPQARTTAVVWTVAKAAQVAIRDGLAESRALLAAAFGLSPGKAIQARMPRIED